MPASLTFADHLGRDVRYGLRQLGRNPGFSAIAIATLALGIGVNTAMFSAVDAVLIRPLPYADADRLVVLWDQLGANGPSHGFFSTPLEWQARRPSSSSGSPSPESVTRPGSVAATS